MPGQSQGTQTAQPWGASQPRGHSTETDSSTCRWMWLGPYEQSRCTQQPQLPSGGRQRAFAKPPNRRSSGPGACASAALWLQVMLGWRPLFISGKFSDWRQESSVWLGAAPEDHPEVSTESYSPSGQNGEHICWTQDWFKTQAGEQGPGLILWDGEGSMSLASPVLPTSAGE